jgi:hypothetical protein
MLGFFLNAPALPGWERARVRGDLDPITDVDRQISLAPILLRATLPSRA